MKPYRLIFIDREAEKNKDMKEIHCKNYHIHINDIDSLIRDIESDHYSKVVAIVDKHSEYLCLPFIVDKTEREIHVIRVEEGEKHKTIDTCKKVWSDMVDHEADRHTLCLNIGGGVIGDMGGFCASTYMRGIDFIQIPTTLLAQVDASVGGKLGVDFNSIKNMIGVIRDPKGVYIFTDFLDSLPYRQILSGYAELIKHGLIRDKQAYENLTKLINLESVRWEQFIYDSLLLKKSITDEDPYDHGIRKILNFGHTVGHAVESLNIGLDSHLYHGEAIAIGMICEAHISYQKGMISKEDCDGVKRALIKLYRHHPEAIHNREEIIRLMKTDKKNKGDNIRFSLLDGIGHAVYDQRGSVVEINNSLDYYLS